MSGASSAASRSSCVAARAAALWAASRAPSLGLSSASLSAPFSASSSLKAWRRKAGRRSKARSPSDSERTSQGIEQQAGGTEGRQQAYPRLAVGAGLQAGALGAQDGDLFVDRRLRPPAPPRASPRRRRPPAQGRRRRPRPARGARVVHRRSDGKLRPCRGFSMVGRAANRRAPFSEREQHRHRRTQDQVARHAAEDHLAQPALRVGALDDEVAADGAAGSTIVWPAVRLPGLTCGW